MSTTTADRPPLLRVADLRVGFRQGDEVRIAVDGVSFEVYPGETFALVGESGSGKSVTALSVLRLLPLNGRLLGGAVQLAGENLFALSERALYGVRGGRVGIVFQDPMTSLNPVMTIGSQIAEVLLLHTQYRGGAMRRRTLELLEQVGLPEPARLVGEYPHRLSGGMRQRVMIAVALAGEPELLIADEPTTALDVTVQAQILELLKGLKREAGLTLWLITHDLGIVADIADRIAVMQEGRVVEQASCRSFFERPQHPYSQRLLELLPRIDACRDRETESPKPPLLELHDFKVYYPVRSGLLQRVVDHVRAVDGVSLSLGEGETLALVGESGCGKTSLGKGLLNLLGDHQGTVRFDGVDLAAIDRAEQRRLRSRMQIVFQDPYSAMNPRMVVGDIVAEGLRATRGDLTDQECRERIESLLRAVGLQEGARLSYPHEFSGGQRQRICIARALAVEPRLIVCDEPTSALDVSVQAQILSLLRELQQSRGLSYLFITHDLGVVAELAHQVAVMHRGRIVELGPVSQVLLQPAHPYTRTLLAAVPRLRRTSYSSF